MPYYTDKELLDMGFRSIGREVRISKKATVLRPDLISLGSHIRIDDFCVISPTVEPFSFGSYIHIGPFCSLIGAASITMADFSGLSARVTIYTSSDEYSGRSLTNPTVPDEYRNVVSQPVELGRHVIVGTGAVILPGASVGHGSAIAAMALVNKPMPSGVVAGGQPCRTIKSRNDHYLVLERKLKEKYGEG